MAKPSDGAIFNSSRGIIYSSNKRDFAAIAAQKTLELRDAINQLKIKNQNLGESRGSR